VYTATLVVHNSNGLASSPAARVIHVGSQPPVPVINLPTTSGYAVGQVVNVTGSASDAEDGPLPASALSWDVKLFHVDETNPGNTHSHPHTQLSGSSTLNFTVPPPEDLYASAGSYLLVTLTATDSEGLTGTATKVVNPKRVKVWFATSPNGLKLTVQGIVITPTVPLSVTVWPNWQVTLNAPASQAGRPFDHWSDGGGAAHTITAPSSPLTYTATYGAVPALNQKVWLPLVIR
jgi:hypothetical protein